MLCAAGFLIGRLSVPIGSSSNCAELTEAQPQDDQAAQALQVTTAQSDDGGWHPVAADWARLANTSGLMQSRPPIEPGDTGQSSYVIQPFQVCCLRTACYALLS
jgi:hypothetical protein